MIDRFWDPFLRACEETETVVCLHNASSSWTAARSPGMPLEIYTSLFPVNAMVAAADWLWAQVPTRFPNIKIAFSEGGISWVPMLIDRIDYVLTHSAVGSHGWDDPSISPIDALRRNFWFCTIDLGSTFALARPHRRRPHLPRERLPARRFHLARHPTQRRGRVARRSGRRRPQGHMGERVEAVPPSRYPKPCNTP